MKKTFKGIIHDQIPTDWDELTGENPWLNSQILNSARDGKRPCRLITHPQYCCLEYKMAINIFSFGKINFKISFHVIAPPVSVDECGFAGDIDALIADHNNTRGMFLMLNIDKNKLPRSHKVAVGRTLSTAVFYNSFITFEDYFNSIRSSYRRRINIARERAKDLKWKKLENYLFDEKMYALYLNVLYKSKYPLETLCIEFFRNLTGDIYVLYQEKEPLAFVLIKWHMDELHFLFGGMDYGKRDQYNLYYNMLLKILEIGIENGAKKIDFGQTAESSKCRLGCQLEDKYMVLFNSNKAVNLIARLFSGLLEYSPPKEKYHIYK